MLPDWYSAPDWLAQELNRKEGLCEPEQQTLANILNTVWQNLQSFEKMKDKMKIYARSENCSSLVKKCNKEIWQAHFGKHKRKATTTTALKNVLKYSPMSVDNTCI